MTRRVIAVAAALAMGLVAAAARPADDAGTKARVDELYKRLEELQKKYGYGSEGQGGKGYELTPERRAGWSLMEEVRSEIAGLTLGAEVVAKYDEYRRKSEELNKQFTEVAQDANLDREAKQARLAEIQRQRTALWQEYGEVIRRRSTVDTELWRRQARKRNLEALKGLLKPANEEEWKVLEPRLDEVVRLIMELRGVQGRVPATFFAVTTQRWQNPPTGTPEGALMAAVKGEKPEVAEVKTKLDALRKARADEQARKDAELAEVARKLKPARDALRELLSVRQEAVLVVEGILE